jgi:hypothetical protein
LPAEERFLANMGLVRWLDGAAWPPEQITVRTGHAIGVAPDYPPGSGWELAEPAYEFKYVDGLFGATKTSPAVTNLVSLIQTPGQFDLFHYAGHGVATQDDIANSGIVVEVRQENGSWTPVSLSSTMVEQYCNIREEGGNRPLVFLNACQVGRAGADVHGTLLCRIEEGQDLGESDDRRPQEGSGSGRCHLVGLRRLRRSAHQDHGELNQTLHHSS